MSVDIKEIVSFIGNSAKLDEYAANYIWGVQPDGSYQMIGEVRGYGAIQNLFLDKSGKCDFAKADAFQDALGRFIADAITEKIQRLQQPEPQLYQTTCSCDSPVNGGYQVCRLCGGRIETDPAPQERRCFNCGTLLEKEELFCGICRRQ